MRSFHCDFGRSELTVKLTLEDTPLFGFLTVNEFVAPEAKSILGSATFNFVVLMNVVERSCPFQNTTAPGTKPAPLTVTQRFSEPAVAEFGDNEFNDGVGFAC